MSFSLVLEEKPDDAYAFACKFFIDPRREEEVGAATGGVPFDMGIFK